MRSANVRTSPTSSEYTGPSPGHSLPAQAGKLRQRMKQGTAWALAERIELGVNFPSLPFWRVITRRGNVVILIQVYDFATPHDK